MVWKSSALSKGMSYIKRVWLTNANIIYTMKGIKESHSSTSLAVDCIVSLKKINALYATVFAGINLTSDILDVDYSLLSTLYPTTT
jgi:hypothetical protein